MTWEHKKIIHFNGKYFEELEVGLIKEKPLTLYLNEKEFITLLCYPEDLEELALGFLKSEGLIESKNQIRKISLSDDCSNVHIEADITILEERLYEKRIVTTGCGKGSIFYFALDSLKCRFSEVKRKWDYREIITLMRNINTERGTKNIRGLHVCGLYDSKNFVVREDIGRHNALDKIIGYCLLNDIDTEDSVVFTTGRISSEILLKSAKINAGVIVSRSTPTDLALEIAEKLNITIIGYVRGNQMTIYNTIDRILT
ncbi:MAG: formate dehydrogenase accessory sulfurtransferase FdhD [Proteobacteria bacterium]|nr:formate dehydrogenase accessory sulfurtransferase FdhD [Pseudomonadota bacterium]